MDFLTSLSQLVFKTETRNCDYFKPFKREIICGGWWGMKFYLIRLSFISGKNYHLDEFEFNKNEEIQN